MRLETCDRIEGVLSHAEGPVLRDRGKEIASAIVEFFRPHLRRRGMNLETCYRVKRLPHTEGPVWLDPGKDIASVIIDFLHRTFGGTR